MTPSRAVAWFDQRFRALGTRARAEQEKRYMKSALKFHGVTVPQVRAECGAFLKAHPELDRDGLLAICRALFATQGFNLRHAALFLLERRAKWLVPEDLPWLAEWVREAACWAHVDLIAPKLVGPVLEAHPACLKVLRGWARDESFWLRRAALLAQLDALRAGRGDFELWEELALPMLGEKEFFIRKAIGWVLRDLSRKRPALTRRFVDAHHEEMSGLSLREATKRLA